MTPTDPASMIRDAIDAGKPQSEIAEIYALIIVDFSKEANWTEINSAITDKWTGKTALIRVKGMAWKIVNQKGCSTR